MRTVHVLILLLLLSSVDGCAIIENDEQPIEEAEGYFFFSCGPTDGPAFEIFIPTSPQSSCESMEVIPYSQPWAQTFTRIYITQFPNVSLDAVATYYFGRENNPEATNGTDGWAGYCANDEQTCLEANTGSIQLTPVQQGFIDARININYSDNSRYNAHLQLEECNRSQPLFCG